MAAFGDDSRYDRWLAELVRERNARAPTPQLERRDSEIASPIPPVRAFQISAERVVFVIGCQLFDARLGPDGLTFVDTHRVAPPSARCAEARRVDDSILMVIEPTLASPGQVEVVRIVATAHSPLEHLESVELRFTSRPTPLEGGRGLYARFPLVVGPFLGGSERAFVQPWPSMRRRGEPRWTPLLAPAGVLRTPVPAGDPWLHLVVVCDVEAGLSCRATGVVAPEGLPAVAGGGAYVAISGDHRTTLLRIAAGSAGLISVDGIVPTGALHVGEWDGHARVLVFRPARNEEPPAPILIEAPLEFFGARVRALAAENYVRLPALEQPNTSEGIVVLLSRDAVAYSVSRRSGLGEIHVLRAGMSRRIGEGMLDGLTLLGHSTLVAWSAADENHVALLDRGLTPSDASVSSQQIGGQIAWQTATPQVWVTAAATTADVHRLRAGELRTIGHVASSCGRATGCFRGVITLEDRTFLAFWNEMVEVRIDGDQVTEVRSPLEAVVQP